MHVPLPVLLLTLVLQTSALGEGDQAASAAGLTLSRAVEIALASNPLVRAAEQGEAAANAQVQEARAGRIPKVQVLETVSRSNNPVSVFGSLLEQGQFGPQDFSIDSLNDPDPMTSFRTTLNAQMPIFAQLQIDAGIGQAQLGQASAKAQQDALAQKIRFEVIRAFYGIRVAEARKAVAQESILMAEADLKRMADLFDTGVVVSSDLLAMRVQKADFLQKQIQANGEARVAYAALNTVMGLPIGEDVQMAKAFEDRAFELPVQEVLIQAGLTERPDLQQAEMDVKRAQEALRAVKGKYLPQIGAFGSVNNNAESEDHESSDWTIGAQFSLDLLDAGRLPRLHRAQADLEAAKARQEHVSKQIQLEVVQACEMFSSAESRLKVAQEAVQQAEEALRIVRDRYEVGLTAVTEVLRAQIALVQARMALLGARYDDAVGYASALLASGTLRDVNAFEK